MQKPALAAIGVLALAAIAMLVVLMPANEKAPPPGPVADDAEAAAIKASGGLVRREVAKLDLRMKTGEVPTLTDHISCGDLPCPKELMTRYRYQGWDERAGGYRLDVTPGIAEGETSVMVLPFAAEAVLLEERPATGSAGVPARIPLPAPPPSVAADEGLSDWLAEVARGRDQDEAPRLAQSQGTAKRDGARLTLTLAGGKRLTMTDDLVCGQLSCPPRIFRSFNYSGTSPGGHYHLVQESWDELATALLVANDDGNITGLVGMPKFSPDGKYALAGLSSLEWSAPHRLEVWSLAGKTPELAFSLPASDQDDTVYDVVDWPDNDHARLRRGPWDGDTRTEAMLVHDTTGWHIEASEGSD